MTIDYTYDPLYRLTAADYDNADYYHYAYDAVGNRLTQESMVSGLTSTNTYAYDTANRLVDVDGVPYTWDANGNLLSDGVNSYAYDSANRLVGFDGSEGTTTYGYNGLSDRLTQNGVTYTLDINSGLTQVLDDGENTYTYGLGRISQQQGTTAEYFLGDALGSVRQLADAAGQVTLVKSYEPYGSEVSSVGSGENIFGYTGEQQDASGLVYLRARYYNPTEGRFLSRDTWGGDDNRPLSLNRWLYVEGNPINYSDPTGKYRDCPPGYLSTDNGCVRIPNITSRQKWGAKSVRAKLVCGRTGCVVVGEGFYDPECNPNGYALYSILYPDRTLADIYDTIVVHHAGNTNNPTIQSIQNEHMEKGDVDIDYHYIIAKNGIIYEGRDIGARGAHVAGANTGKVGILVVGDFEPGDYVDLPIVGEVKINDEPADNPTQAQKTSLEEMTIYLDALYGIDRIVGHQYYNKTRCPGKKLTPYVSYLNSQYGAPR